MAGFRVWLAATVLCALGLALTATPVLAQEVQWRFDYNQARQEAKDKNRPLILDFGTPGCYWCQKLDASTFRDPAVIPVLNERFVPVKIDATRSTKLAGYLNITSYPTLVFATPNGQILGVQEGYVTADRFAQQLQRALVESAPSAAVPGGDSGGIRLTTPEAAPSPVDPERRQTARDLLMRAREDYNSLHYFSCLERCDVLTEHYADLPEGEEARRLAGSIKDDPKRAQQLCDDLTDHLGELYLGLAESAIRQGQSQRAITYFERVLIVCPGSRHAMAAQLSLTQLQQDMTAKPTPKTSGREYEP